MEVLAQKVLGMFGYLNKDVLDLHELFEAGGNDPDARSAVVDTVERLVEEGLFDAYLAELCADGCLVT